MRNGLQDYHRAMTEAVGNALDSQSRQRNYRPSLFPAQWPLGRILGTTRRWLISGRFFTYKFGAHPIQDWASKFACGTWYNNAPERRRARSLIEPLPSLKLGNTDWIR